MRWTAVAAALLTVLPLLSASVARGQEDSEYDYYTVIFDFACNNEQYGKDLADTCRRRLRHHAECLVLDQITVAEVSRPLPVETDEKTVEQIMTKRAGCNVGIWGTVRKNGYSVTAELKMLDLRDPKKPVRWTKTFTDSTERARGIIGKAVIEALRGEPEWVPPEHDDEELPKDLGKPINRNGNFDQGAAFWQEADNVCTFLDKTKDRGTILRIQTDVEDGPWVEYMTKLTLGLADPNYPPKIRRTKGYDSVGGITGVHFRSHWIPATPGWRYWLTIDAKQAAQKVFVKGFFDYRDRADGLPEKSLVEMKMTPAQFAHLPVEKQKKLIAADAEKHPDRYRRECYRWYLQKPGPNGQWHTYSEVFPPRGGLPKNVQWLRIEIYAYWPAGEYQFDNCFLYKDPRLKAPVPEEKARTKSFETSSKLTRPTDQLEDPNAVERLDPNAKK